MRPLSTTKVPTKGGRPVPSQIVAPVNATAVLSGPQAVNVPINAERSEADRRADVRITLMAR
jgi:hypothetical protein